MSGSRRAALDALSFGEVQYARTLRGLCAAYASPSGALAAVLSAPEAGTFRHSVVSFARQPCLPSFSRLSLALSPFSELPVPPLTFAAALFRTVTDMRDVSAKLSSALSAAAQVRFRVVARSALAGSALCLCLALSTYHHH